MSELESLARKTGLARRVTLASYGVFLFSFAVTALMRPNMEPVARAVIWMLQTLPLLLFLPGLLRSWWKTYLWLCFMLLLYFLIIMDSLFSASGGVLQGAQLLLLVVLFTAATLFARWRQQELAAMHLL